MGKVFVPPIKCQGVKTKLVPLIKRTVQWQGHGTWIEPFMGSGVVGFNMQPKKGVFADSNPHLIRFYQEINAGILTPTTVKSYLVQEGAYLLEQGKSYYYKIRERFNDQHNPLDFLFLNRAGFNGMIRFNQKGYFNVPFNHKPNRFRQAYITKIVNQVNYVYNLCQMNNYTFVCQDFRESLKLAGKDDFVYCDPPYSGRHVDYFNSWSEADEVTLLALLEQNAGNFMLSTWHSNEYRDNQFIKQLPSRYHITTQAHFYHVGAKESNRKPMLEALVTNYLPPKTQFVPPVYQQAYLFATD